MSPKDKLHQLVDDLPESALGEAERLLQQLRDRSRGTLPRILAEAPYDDEPETEEEQAAVQAAREALARGDVVSDEDIRQQLGL